MKKRGVSKDKRIYSILIIIGILVVAGFLGNYYLGDVDGVTNYVFFGKLKTTGLGSVTSTECSNAGGRCRYECLLGEYKENALSCAPPVFKPNENLEYTTGGISSESFVCCLRDIRGCGSGIISVGEECDEGSDNGEECDNSNGDCRYCSDNCEWVDLDQEFNCGDKNCDEDQECTINKFGEGECGARSAEFCGDGTCNNGETCSSCEEDCGKCPVNPGTGGTSGPPPEPPTCSEVNGTCSKTCNEGYIPYGNLKTDKTCSESFEGLDLTCCVLNGTSQEQLYGSVDEDTEDSDDKYKDNESIEDGSISDFFNGNSEINLQNLFSAKDYLVVKILVLIALGFIIFFVVRGSHFAFWNKLTGRTLFPSDEEKIKLAKRDFTKTRKS